VNLVGYNGTMWKCHDFSVIQILREINFRESRSSKNVIFAILNPSEFGFSSNFSLPKSAKIHKNQTSEPLNVLKCRILHF